MNGLTLSDAAAVLQPPIPRRELARRMRDVADCGSAYGRRGRRAALYPVTALMRAHAEWVRERHLASDRKPCQNSAQEESA